MRLSQYSLIFLLIFIPFAIIVDVKLNLHEILIEESINLDQNFTAALADASQLLIRDMEEVKGDLDKEGAVNVFFRSMYASLGILDDSSAQEQLALYIPVICITDVDGFYIRYTEMTQNDNNNFYSVTKWTDLLPYNNGNHEKNIAAALEEKLSYYCTAHNAVAQKFGIKYQFYLPETDFSDFERAMNETGIIVFFQGYPIGSYSGKTYSRAAFSRGAIRDAYYYLIEEVGWYRLYHRSTCKFAEILMETGAERKLSPKECAAAGAYACQICEPGGLAAPK